MVRRFERVLRRRIKGVKKSRQYGSSECWSEARLIEWVCLWVREYCRGHSMFVMKSRDTRR